MASIGTAWVDGAWIAAAWVTEAWSADVVAVGAPDQRTILVDALDRASSVGDQGRVGISVDE